MISLPVMHPFIWSSSTVKKINGLIARDDSMNLTLAVQYFKKLLSISIKYFLFKG
jgi:hypothetical protein